MSAVFTSRTSKTSGQDSAIEVLADIPFHNYVKRIDLGITVLLLFIAFNFTLGSDLPRLGYLTAVDAFIAGTFVITGAVILINVQLRLLERQGREAEAGRLDRIAMIGYRTAYLLGMSAALLIL